MRRMIASRGLLVCVLLAGMCGGGAAAHAQGSTETPWPAKAVRLIVPFPPGGATDLVARIIANQVAKDTGQPVIVDNKPGAGGAIGAAEAAKAAPDGYTVLLTTSSTHAIAPHLTKPPYDPVKDFTPIMHLADAASVLLVPPSLPVTSVAELIAYAKANPDTLNFASSGNGTIVHLTGEAFKAQTGITMMHVPYKGTALAIPDLIAGSVHVLFDSIPSGMPHAKNGRLRALAVTGDTRSSLAPDLPTIAEAGLPGFSSVTWFGLYGPRAVAPGIVTRIHAAFERALRNAEVVAGLTKNGVEAAKPGSPDAFAATVKTDSDRWGRIIRERGIKLE